MLCLLMMSSMVNCMVSIMVFKKEEIERTYKEGSFQQLIFLGTAIE